MASQNTPESDANTDEEQSSEQNGSRQNFSLRAFSEMKDTSKSSIKPQDLYKHPHSVVELNNGAPQTSDDSVIKRLTTFSASQNATSTTARRPTDKYYMCPTNTFIASNGDVYEIEPFMLPPPTEIAALFKELKNRRDRSDSNLSVERDTPKAGQPRANLNKESHEKLLTASRLALIEEFHSRSSSPNTTTEVKVESKTFQETLNVIPQAMQRRKSVTIRGGKDGGCSPEKMNEHFIVIPEDSVSEKGSNCSSPESSPYSAALKRKQLPFKSKGYNNDQSNEACTEKPENSICAYPSFLQSNKPNRKNKEEEMFNWSKFSLYKYLMTEMLGIGETGHLQPTAVGHMQNFLTVPSKVERFIGFGFFICLDAFLNVITFLPIRVAYSLYLLFCEGLNIVLKYLEFRGSSTGSIVGNRGVALKGLFHRTHLYDLMKGVIMVFSCFVLYKLNMSRVYHYIRGQTLIKLYVLTAMLEIFDKLLCSFGQDAFDSLYCITRMRPEPSRIFGAFFIAAVYAILHSGLYFMLVATLTVAINSSDQALVTVLVLNNFGEIKSFVFKKFDKQNLFQLSCSDITERFQLVLFLVCISGVALAQAGPAWVEIFPSHMFVIVLMVSAEAVADWIKHAFISKFNHINANVYDDFARVLRKDILNCHKDKVILDQTYAITKRVGLAQIPLGCVSIRYLILAFSSPGFQNFFASKSGFFLLLLFFFWFSVLVVCKITIGLGLVRYAGIIHNQELKLRAEEEKENSNGSHRFETQMSMNQLSNIERFTVYKGRVVG